MSSAVSAVSSRKKSFCMSVKPVPSVSRVRVDGPVQSAVLDHPVGRITFAQQDGPGHGVSVRFSHVGV